MIPGFKNEIIEIWSFRMPISPSKAGTTTSVTFSFDWVLINMDVRLDSIMIFDELGNELGLSQIQLNWDLIKYEIQ